MVTAPSVIKAIICVNVHSYDILHLLILDKLQQSALIHCSRLHTGGMRAEVRAAWRMKRSGD
jgi:hypothetical protein